MTNVPPIIKKFRKKFPTHVEISDRPGSYVVLRSQREQEELESFLLEVDKQAREETAKSILIHLDELEIRQPEDLKTDNWRNWKYIRNSIVDKYLQHQERKGEK